jgi:hypothetical protein
VKILIHSYDIDSLEGSGTTLRTIACYLEGQGDTVLISRQARAPTEIKSWSPDLIISHQWSTEEASQWATILGVPFVMLIHGPGQFEQFMPQCDLVVFNTQTQLDLARAALGNTPSAVLYPPVFRDDYATDGAGDCLTLIGLAANKGTDVFISLARSMSDEKFLLVTDDEIVSPPTNLRVQSKTADVRTIYARTKLLLMPSMYESYGRVAIEAAMSGIPTVASDLPGIREATANHAIFVKSSEDWKISVTEALADLEVHRQRAHALAHLRDPSNDLAEFRNRLLQLARSGRRKPTLSLCMTVANEAPTLEKAVRSVAPFVDEIIIGVDSKSMDETAEIARRLATKYFEFDETSPPNFPRMRNRALDLVETDWAIVLDGHEWIENTELIRPGLETTAWSIEIRMLCDPDENGVPALAFPFPRVLRRHVRFVGAPIHEEVFTPLAKRDARLEIKLWHQRPPGLALTTRSQQKTGELERLREAWEDHNDRRSLFYLANGLREAGRHGEAIAAYVLYLQAPNFAEEGWQALLYLARCYAILKEWTTARELFEQATAECPQRAEALVGLGYALLELGETEKAAERFQRAASLPEPLNCRLFVEVPLYRWGAWHGLALARDRLGDYWAALEAEEKARVGGAGAWATRNIYFWFIKAAREKGRDLAKAADSI